MRKKHTACTQLAGHKLFLKFFFWIFSQEKRKPTTAKDKQINMAKEEMPKTTPIGRMEGRKCQKTQCETWNKARHVLMAKCVQPIGKWVRLVSTLIAPMQILHFVYWNNKRHDATNNIVWLSLLLRFNHLLKYSFVVTRTAAFLNVLCRS